MERVLTIAGAAAQGSAGIQADLKTFQERNVYGMSAITATVTNQSRTEKKIFFAYDRGNRSTAIYSSRKGRNRCDQNWNAFFLLLLLKG